MVDSSVLTEGSNPAEDNDNVDVQSMFSWQRKENIREQQEEWSEGDEHDDDLDGLEAELLREGGSAQVSAGGSGALKHKFEAKINTALKERDTVNSSHAVANSITRSEKVSDKQSKHTGRDDRATSEQVMDPRTRLILFKLLNSGFMSRIDGCLSTGKEANVYYAAGKEGEGMEYAVKIFKTSILVFKDRDKYISGEHRYRHGYCRSNPRKMVKMWAEKEMRNLRRVHAAGIPCPNPIIVKSNVLIMEFLGDNGWPAPRLRDVKLSTRRMQEMYDQCVTHMITMFRDCKLVHGDLSEYNLLYHNKLLYVIDVSQSMEQDHPHSLDFLRMDCRNVNTFFKRHGVDLIQTHDLFNLICDPGATCEAVPAMIEGLKAKARDSVQAVDAEVDEAVFMSSFIPRTLYQVDNCEREVQLMADGGREHAYIAAVSNMLAQKPDETEVQNTPKKVKNSAKKIDTPAAGIEPIAENTGENEDNRLRSESSCSSESCSDNSSCSDNETDEDNEGARVREKRPRAFGQGNLGTMQDEERATVKAQLKETKRAAKIERAEKRKVKLPKHLKKQKIKNTSGKKK